MLASLAMISHSAPVDPALKEAFLIALERAENNITEKEEPEALASIKVNYTGAFLGDTAARQKTVRAIVLLAKINRTAMITEDRRARQFGSAGAWGVVFMAVTVFFAGMLFKRSFSKNLAAPLEEIYRVISARQAGDPLRRCFGPDQRGDIRLIYDGINALLDQCRFQSVAGKAII
jgi:hypothetical protein